MPSLISHLGAKEKRELFHKLNYLNIEEYSGFCKRHGIEISIYMETESGKLKKTSEKDRKGETLRKIQKYLETGTVPKPTTLAYEIVQKKPWSQKLSAKDRIYFGQYDRKHAGFLKIMKDLTDGQFRDGAIARFVIRDFWVSGVAPTFSEFAKAWMKAVEDHKKPKPEWAFLTDLANGFSESDWKKLRVQNAKSALSVLNGLAR